MPKQVSKLTITLGPVVQKPVRLTLGQNLKQIFQHLIEKLGNISSEILSGSILVLYSKGLKETDT